jgi:hypothetical protein
MTHNDSRHYSINHNDTECIELGAIGFSIMTISIMTFSTMTPIVITPSIMTLNINLV